MKHIKLTFILLGCTMLFYTSCKKAAMPKPAKTGTNTAITAQMASRLAVRLYQSLTGKNGGADITKGIHAPANITSAHKGLVTYAVNPLCGMAIDTSFKVSNKVGDTIATTFSGQFRFTYVCNGDTLNSYNNSSGYQTTVDSPNVTDSTQVSQNLTIKALNPAFSLMSVTGSMNYNELKQVYNDATYQGPFSLTNTDIYSSQSLYSFVGVQVAVLGGIAVVTTGTVWIQDSYYNVNSQNTMGEMNLLLGKIAFIGNNLATVTFYEPDGSTITYTVNVVTGKIV